MAKPPRYKQYLILRQGNLDIPTAKMRQTEIKNISNCSFLKHMQKVM